MNFTSQWLANYESRNAPVRVNRDAEAVKDESELHDAILAECRRRGWLVIHSRMDRKTTMMRGVADFIVYADHGKMFHVECKAKGGKLSLAQREFIAWAARLGHSVDVVTSVEQFMEAVK